MNFTSNCSAPLVNGAAALCGRNGQYLQENASHEGGQGRADVAQRSSAGPVGGERLSLSVENARLVDCRPTAPVEARLGI